MKKQKKPQAPVDAEMTFGSPVSALYSGKEYRAAKDPQPEPKVLRNIAWSLTSLAAVVVTYLVCAPLHNAALLGLWLVVVIAGLGFGINLLLWVVKQFTRRQD